MGKGTAAVPAGWQGFTARVLAAGIVLLIAISVIGILDHRHKGEVMARAVDASWYCEHKHVRCDEARWRASVEDRWNARETGYKSALVIIAALTVLVAARGLYRGSRQRSVRSMTPDP